MMFVKFVQFVLLVSGMYCVQRALHQMLWELIE